MAKESPVSIWRVWDRHQRRLLTDDQKSVTNLSNEVRQITGIFWSYRPCSVDELAKILMLPRARVSVLLRAIQKSTERAVADALAGRFTVDAIADIPIGGLPIYCRECGQKINKVPCCKCFLSRLQFNRKKRARQIKGSLPQCHEPTQALPGSHEKLEVMQQRALSGFSVFCRGDARCQPKPWRVRTQS